MSRRAPKVTVTREGDTLCQKGCYPSGFVLLLFFVRFLMFECQLKRAGGRASSLSSRPPAVEYVGLVSGGCGGIFHLVFRD